MLISRSITGVQTHVTFHLVCAGMWQSGDGGGVGYYTELGSVESVHTVTLIWLIC